MRAPLSPDRAFTLLETLLMMAALFVFTMIVAALVLKQQRDEPGDEAPPGLREPSAAASSAEASDGVN